jgi:hypothetical protein
MRFNGLAATLLLAGCSDGGAPSAPSPGPSAPLPTPAGTTPRIGGCDIFPEDNAWNRNVSSDPIDPASDALIAAMSPNAAIHLDLGTTEEYYGIPYTVVPASQPLISITYGTGGADYSDESDPGPMPIPLGAPIEGGSTADPDPTSGDRHVLVLQEGSFRVSSSAVWDLKVNHTRPPVWTSADAAGLPILPGLLRYEEALGGTIAHALRFTMPGIRRA